jgi:hypothetical protein
MKIKIVGRYRQISVKDPDDTSKSIRSEEYVYDIYHGFTGLPMTFPFHTKWVLEKTLREHEMIDYLIRLKINYKEFIIKL